jgi:hypothetical protein
MDRPVTVRVISALGALLLVAACVAQPPPKPTEVLGPIVDTISVGSSARHQKGAPPLPQQRPNVPRVERDDAINKHLDEIDDRLRTLDKKVGSPLVLPTPNWTAQQ